MEKALWKDPVTGASFDTLTLWAQDKTFKLLGLDLLTCKMRIKLIHKKVRLFVRHLVQARYLTLHTEYIYKEARQPLSSRSFHSYKRRQSPFWRGIGREESGGDDGEVAWSSQEEVKVPLREPTFQSPRFSWKRHEIMVRVPLPHWPFGRKILDINLEVLVHRILSRLSMDLETAACPYEVQFWSFPNLASYYPCSFLLWPFNALQQYALYCPSPYFHHRKKWNWF